jgi:hypothetical protein
VIGTVTRLSSQQATISITVVDGIPLPHGEDYIGVIRSQDIRATEKDRIKIGDCFRGGDIVKGEHEPSSSTLRYDLMNAGQVVSHETITFSVL